MNSVHYFRDGAGVPPRFLCPRSPRASRSSQHLQVQAFGQIEYPTMPSADFCIPIPAPLDTGSPYERTDMQISPGNAHPPPHLCLPHIRPCLPVRYRTLEIIASLSSMTASYAILVHQASALPAASFRPHLAMAALAVRLMVPPDGPIGDFNPQVNAPCRAHSKKRAASAGSPFVHSAFQAFHLS